MAPVESRGMAVMRGGGVERWVGSAGVGGAGVPHTSKGYVVNFLYCIHKDELNYHFAVILPEVL